MMQYCFRETTDLSYEENINSQKSDGQLILHPHSVFHHMTAICSVEN